MAKTEAAIAILGCAASNTMFQAAKKLAAVNHFFHP